MPILASLFFGFIPMLVFALLVIWLDRYEKEPGLVLLTVFAWGVVVAAGGAFMINSVFGLGFYLVSGSEQISDLATGSLVAPVVEELLKGLAVLLVFLILRREFDSVLDGIIYAAIVALGFAATENSYYIYRGFAEDGWPGLWSLVFIRVVWVGWQHPFYTAFIGIGLAVARLNPRRAVTVLAPVLGLGIAMLIHAVHNTLPTLLGGLGLLAGTALDWSGWVAMALVALWALWREGVLLRKHLQDEVSEGRMTAQQYRTAGSALARFSASSAAALRREYGSTVRFYQVCGELAHKKEQLARLGEEGGNQAIIEKLRAELAQLSPRALS
jgi:RsiW-degrading membrane proteinase PrsW (M82 family)